MIYIIPLETPSLDHQASAWHSTFAMENMRAPFNPCLVALSCSQTSTLTERNVFLAGKK